MRIIVEARNVCGVNLLYPANSAAAALARVAGGKTLSELALANAVAMGLQVEIKDFRDSVETARGIARKAHRLGEPEPTVIRAGSAGELALVCPVIASYKPMPGLA
jgi:hypothetical protein